MLSSRNRAFRWRCRDVGLPRPRPDAAEVAVRADGSRLGEGGPEAQVEVAADAAEQRGPLLHSTRSLHVELHSSGEPADAGPSRNAGKLGSTHQKVRRMSLLAQIPKNIIPTGPIPQHLVWFSLFPPALISQLLCVF